MSGGTPMQNAVILTVVVLLVIGVVAAVVLGRLRRARATGSAEAGSVRSRGQAKEIADRVHGICRRDEGGGDGTGGGSVRVQVRGAARLMAVLRADDRFAVTDRGAGEEYWSFAVAAPGGADHEAVRRGVIDVLARNGVTAAVPSDTG